MTFRHRLLLFGLTIATLAALVVFLTAGVFIRRSVADRMQERLFEEAGLLADRLSAEPSLLDEGNPAGADGLARQTAGALGLRVTLIAPDGRVLGDSSVLPGQVSAMENHGTRPEIVAARESGMGHSTRESGTLHDRLIYLARRVDRGGVPIGFVRLALPDSDLSRTTADYSGPLAFTSFLALVGVALLGYLVAARFSRPIESMARAADAIAAGGAGILVEYESSDEIGRLGAAMNRMTVVLGEQIQALQAEKRLLDTILGGMSEGILAVDRDRHVLLANRVLRELLGLRQGTVAGLALLEVVREESVVAAFDAALQRGETSREVVRLGTGRGIAFELTVAPLHGTSREPAGAIGVFFDVTRLMALESVRREFVADVSHELRTPLTSIRAFGETLLAGGLEDPENNRRFVEIIKKHSDRMEAILDDLTDLSRIETGAVALERQPVELAAVAREIVESLRPKAEAMSVEATVEIPPGLTVWADRRRLEQVLLNLADNAVKFNQPGGRVIVRAGASDAAGAGGVRLEVEDTGVGIPSVSLDRVFHRFYRIDRARSRELGGTGLGLSIVKHLVRLHGGTVRAESEPGRGSRFIVEFPGPPSESRS